METKSVSGVKAPGSLVYLFPVLIITAIVFSRVFQLGWTNWDDDVYVYENPLVQEFSIREIFTNPAAHTFNPLVVLSWAMEWKVAGMDPWLYHLNNLLLHLGCSTLVFFILQRLGISLLWSAIGTLLFSIHPLRVESVAWITERKDVLYAFFYLGALLQYLYYLKNNSRIHLAVSFLWFCLSLLCKIQAVTLAPVLILVDWFTGRKIVLKTLVEKLPFFAAAVAVGWLGLHFLAEGRVVDLEVQTHSLTDRFVLGFYAYSIYIIKLLVPYTTSAFYPVPSTIGFMHYALCVLSMTLIGFAVFNFKKYKAFAFGLAFFTINIVLLLQIVAAGSAFLADRFTYVACLGPVFFLCIVAQNNLKLRPAARPLWMGVFGAMVAYYAFASASYAKVWKNSDTLWTDVIGKYPGKSVVAYVNRGDYLKEQGEKERAMEDFNMAISLKEDYFIGYLNRGNIHFDNNQLDKARMDYLKCITLKAGLDTSGIRIDSEAGNIYGNLGVIYGKSGVFDSAMICLNIAIKADPGNKSHYLNRAFANFNSGSYDASTADFKKYLTYDSQNANVMNSIGVNYLRTGRFQDALLYFDRAVALREEVSVFHLNRANALYAAGKKAEALEAANRAVALGEKVDPAFLKVLQGM